MRRLLIVSLPYLNACDNARRHFNSTQIVLCCLYVLGDTRRRTIVFRKAVAYGGVVEIAIGSAREMVQHNVAVACVCSGSIMQRENVVTVVTCSHMVKVNLICNCITL